MRKKQDIIWEQSTLWESVEKWVTKYLKKNHSEYRELQVKAMRIVDESEEYQNCIKEEEDSEAEVKRKLSSKEWKLVDRYVTAVNNRWLCCGDYLYQSGMKDILLLMENKW